jgi:hypothetical protein
MQPPTGHPRGLPPGGVVIGSAQSGDQIAEELLAADRRVMLAVSPLGAPPPGTAAGTPWSGYTATASSTNVPRISQTVL